MLDKDELIESNELLCGVGPSGEGGTVTLRLSWGGAAAKDEEGDKYWAVLCELKPIAMAGPIPRP